MRALKLEDVKAILDARVVSESFDGEIEAKAGCGADLLSDVLAFTHADTLLLTGLTNPQVIVTAEVAGILGVVFVRGKTPPPETVRLAEERGVPLMSTRFTMFEACGRLYAAGMVGCDEHSPFGRRQQASVSRPTG